jgi:4,5-DOPA dioxygenase extradiol
LSKPPVLFIGHGAPMNATRDTAFTRALAALGGRLPCPRAALFVSAHWETDGSHLTASPKAGKLNDFFGDHADLHALAYEAPGAPDVATEAAALLGAGLDTDRAIDHGVWSVAVRLWPAADVPLTQLSIDRGLDGKGWLALGARLRPLREAGVMIIGSGNIAHNVREIDRNPDAATHDWAIGFDREVAARLAAGEGAALAQWQSLPHAARAVPTPEHLAPLLYVLGAAGTERVPEAIFSGFEHAAISSRSLLWA